jgi:ABC-type cobalamin transport system ATPase subunit
VLVARGRIAASGSPDAVLTSAAGADAFEVSVRSHVVAGSRHPLYSFDERREGRAGEEGER